MYSLIGFAGRAGSGKDTAAAVVSSIWGHRRYAIADPIRHALDRLFRWSASGCSQMNQDFKRRPVLNDESTGLSFSPRQLAQWLGVEAGRELHGENCWVALMEGEYRQHRRLVVPDIRFSNELESIRRLGGVCILIERPDAQPVAHHISEHSLPCRSAFDAVIENTSDLQTFTSNVERVLYELYTHEMEYLQTTFGEIAIDD